MPVAKIKIISSNKNAVVSIAKQITDIAKSLGVKKKGPIPLPTHKMKISTRKTPCSNGSHTFDHWEMSMHKWLVHIEGSEQALRQIMRISVPDSVHIEMTLS